MPDWEPEEGKNEKFRRGLQTWANEFNIRLSALKSLMKIVNKRIPNILPSDPRGH